MFGRVSAPLTPAGGGTQPKADFATMLKRVLAARIARLMRSDEGGPKLRLLQEINRKISSSLDLDEVLDFIIDAVGQIIQYDAASIYIFDPESQTVIKFVGRGYRTSETVPAPLQALCGIVGWVLVSGESVLAPDAPEHPCFINCRDTTRSLLAVPIISDEKVIGAFSLESDRPDAFTEDDLAWLAVLATQTAISIEMALLHAEQVEKKRLEEQLRIARDVQLSLLPVAAPRLDGLDIDGINVPSQGISGDYFDFIDVADGHLGLVVADVVGKGIPASLIMAGFRAFLRAEIRNNYAIRTIFSKVNHLLMESLKDHQFVSAIYGVLDLSRRRFTFSNAGHPPPILLRASGERRYLSTGGPVLGIIRGANYRERFIDLVPGDILLLYTDGLTEAENEAGEAFGRERVERYALENIHLGARQMCEALYGELIDFTGTRRLNDDTTIVIVKVLS
jgi:sigma-B regulation protein RsbU (phosphoserine phosphatase)